MSMEDAVELARVHNLHSAVDVFGKKLELHFNTPDAIKFKLALAETKFTHPGNGSEDVKNTVNARMATITTISDNTQNELNRQHLVGTLHDVRRESETWAREYARFIERLTLLHGEAIAELESFRLDTESIGQAKMELGQILLNALHKVDGLQAQEAKAA